MVDPEPLPGPIEGQALRQMVAHTLDTRVEVILNDAIAVLPYTGGEALDADYCSRVCDVLLHLLGNAVLGGRMDWRNGFIADLQRLALTHPVGVERLFTFAYMVERSALDELALDDSIGATSEPWPSVAQVVRRASFDVLAAYTERLLQEPTEVGVTDRLTTLHTRPLLEAVLGKEVHRAERFGHPIALIFFDVDHLDDINRAHGYGFGDRVLERVGILIRKYFREQDWVARHSEDSFGVLLPETAAENALVLAERVRRMVEERLALRDYRSEQLVQVSVSVAVVIAPELDGKITAEQLVAEAERAVARAKTAGRNCVVRVDVTPEFMTVAGAARYLDMEPAQVEALVASGALPAINDDRSFRLERHVLDQYRARASSS